MTTAETCMILCLTFCLVKSTKDCGGYEMSPWQRWGQKTRGRLYSVRKCNIPHMLEYGCIILPCCMYPVCIKDGVDAINNV